MIAVVIVMWATVLVIVYVWALYDVGQRLHRIAVVNALVGGVAFFTAAIIDDIHGRKFPHKH